MTKTISLTMLTLCTMALFSCAVADPGPPLLEYLEATVQPCAPFEAGPQDPCDNFDQANAPSGGASASMPTNIPVVPTLEKLISRETSNDADQDVSTTHFMVRGVFVPGSTRCHVAGYYPASYITPGTVIGDDADVVCHTDLAVREYIVGKGPDLLPVLTFKDIRYLRFGSREVTSAVLETEVAPIPAARWEGAEAIVWLAPPHNHAVKNLFFIDWWWVRRDGDTIKVVDPEADYYQKTPKNLEDLDVTLEEHRIEAKAAYAKLVERYGGRTCDRELAPALLEDANEEFLDRHLEAHGLNDHPDITQLNPHDDYE